MRHAPKLLELANPLLRSEGRGALCDIARALAEGRRWTDATTRRLRMTLAALRGVARKEALIIDNTASIAWHLARIDELVAQYEILRHREALLAMARTDRITVTGNARRRRSRVTRNARDRRKSAPAA